MEPPVNSSIVDDVENITKDSRTKSGNYLSVENNNDKTTLISYGSGDNPDQQSVTKRSISSTLLAVQEEDKDRLSLDPVTGLYGQTFDEYHHHHGYSDPNKQFRSLKLLQQDSMISDGRCLNS